MMVDTADAVGTAAQPHAKRRRRDSCGLDTLDDTCLLAIFGVLTPLPDLFGVAATCRRFRDLVSGGRMWLVVAAPGSAAPHPLVGTGLLTRSIFPTLQAAVSASRPGDTIVLEPGEHQAAGVVVPWPLHIMGSGALPEDTLLAGPRKCETALDFRASGRVANLAIRSSMGACVLHRRGRLTLEHVSLSVDAGGLDHLFSTLVTTACSVPAPAVATSSTEAQIAGFEQAMPFLLPGVGAPRLCGAGLLSVVESRIRGGSSAVQCWGTGALRGVRCIYRARSTLFWLQVNSAEPGLGPSLHQGACSSLRASVLQPPMLPYNRGTTGNKQLAWDAGAAGAASVKGGASAGVVMEAKEQLQSPATPAKLPAWAGRPPQLPTQLQSLSQAALANSSNAALGGAATPLPAVPPRPLWAGLPLKDAAEADCSGTGEVQDVAWKSAQWSASHSASLHGGRVRDDADAHPQ